MIVCIKPYNILFYNNILNNKGIFSLTPFNQTNATKQSIQPMSSCSATAPIDIPTKGSVNPISGTFNCVYDVDMCSGASVVISDDRSHLSVNCNGKSTVSFYDAMYVPSEIRIYAPSLHTYNGANADAEILIVHAPGSNAKTNGLIISVPVSLTGSGNPDLTAIIQAANSINVNTLSINASAPINYDVNANSFISNNPYYVYYGTLPYDSCGGNYYYAVFTDPVSAAGPLSALIASNIATVQPSMKTNLQKSNGGPVTGADSGSTDEFAVYQVVGDDCDNDATDASKGGTASTDSIGMKVVWGIMIALVILGIWYMFTSGVNAEAPASAVAAKKAVAGAGAGADIEMSEF
jgi:hypothetical protein